MELTRGVPGFCSSVTVVSALATWAYLVWLWEKGGISPEAWKVPGVLENKKQHRNVT